MFESRHIEENLTEGTSSHSRDRTRRDATHILENLLECDPDYEEDLPLIKLFIDGIDGLITLSYENLRTLISNLSRKRNSVSF